MALSQAVKPREKLTGSEWAAKRRYLGPEESAVPGLWRNDQAPYLRVIMDAMAHPDVDFLVQMKCAQAGGSETGRNFLGHAIEHDPGPCLWVLPTKEAAEEQVDERLKPLIKNSLPGYQTKNRHDLSYKSLKLTSMTVYPAWGGSPQALASRPCRYVILDEVDKFPPWSGRDAAPVPLAKARTRTYQHRKKIILISTPTTKDGVINTEYENCADQREFHVPCPHCGEYQLLTWANVDYPKREKSVDRIVHAEKIANQQLARYSCSHCKESFGERERLRIIKKGRWVSSLGLDEQTFSRRIAFRFNALVNPWSNLSDLVEKWIKAQGDPGALMEFVNQELGEPWENQVRKSDRGIIEKKAKAGHKRGIVPSWAGAIVATADTQKDGHPYVVRAIGRHYKTRLIDFGHADSLEMLKDLTLERHYEVEGSAEIMQPRLLLIDSGGGILDDRDQSSTDKVYKFSLTDERIIPVKGHGGRSFARQAIVRRLIKYEPPDAPWDSYEVVLYILDPEYYKDCLSADIANEDETRWEVCEDIDDNYIKQMASEHKVLQRSRSGIADIPRWVPISKGAANHFWDCEYMARAAADLIGAATLPTEDELKEQREFIKAERSRRSRSRRRDFSDPYGRPFLASER